MRPDLAARRDDEQAQGDESRLGRARPDYFVDAISELRFDSYLCLVTSPSKRDSPPLLQSGYST
jgi:hypothetical protein